METINQTTRHTLHFDDVSTKVFSDELREEVEFNITTTSNSNHKMRKSLNSIISNCKIQKQRVNNLKAFINKIKAKFSQDELREVTKLKESIEKSIEVQNNFSEELVFHLESVQSLASIRAQCFVKNSSKFDLLKAVKQMADLQIGKAEQLKVSLSQSIQVFGKPFNQSTQKLMVTADKLRLQQVLLNLQSNAIKCTKPGSRVETNCTLVTAASDYESGESSESGGNDWKIANIFRPEAHPKLVVEVRDTGIGISQEN